MSGKKIAVIGSGVVGLSTAIALGLMNFRVQMFTKESIQTETKNPFFASRYPAASILPHSIHGLDLKELFLPSKNIFQRLLRAHAPGIVQQKHYEVFTDQAPTPPAYAPWMDGFEIHHSTDEKFVPKHPDFPVSRAWSMDMYFTNWPTYASLLQKCCSALNITVTVEDLDLQNITDRFSSSDYAAVVMATGCGFEIQNNHELHLLRGDLVIVQSSTLPVNPEGNVFSYNFNPPKHAYSTKDGLAQDVYCYPRSGELVLGGSRIAGRWLRQQWMGDEPSNYSTGDALEDPLWKIFHLNQEVLANSSNVELSEEAIIEVKTGYRYLGPQSKAKLELDSKGSLPILLSYGYGGSGVSLSWGVAIKSAHMILHLLQPKNSSISDVETIIGHEIENLVSSLTKKYESN